MTDPLPSITTLRGKTVLITGGTRGIGLATGLAFGRNGAHCTLTHRWGSANEEEICAAFEAAGAPPPAIEEADVSRDEDTADLLARMAERSDGVDVFVSNAAMAPKIASLDGYKKRDFLRSFEYSAWPVAAYTKAIHQQFGRYPRHIVGVTSFGTIQHYPGYDAAAAAKAMLETLCRYLAVDLRPRGVNVNLVRPGFVDTDAFSEIFGAEVMPRLLEKLPQRIVRADDVANVVVALCSGLLDSVNGQVIQIDNGSLFEDSVRELFR